MLLDRDGLNVLDSGAPISTEQTCGQCHDTEFIASHSFHTDLGMSQSYAPGEAPSGWVSPVPSALMTARSNQPSSL